jgi:hypothetical protein
VILLLGADVLIDVAAAAGCGAGLIVTRNTRDFARSPIPAVSPGVALGRL